MSKQSIVGLVFFGLIHVLTMVNDSHQAEAGRIRETQYRQQMELRYSK